MNVVMLSPGFPLEMAYFTRALAQTGATVIGVGDQTLQALPPEARDHLAHYEHVSLADEGAVLAALHGEPSEPWTVESLARRFWPAYTW